MKKNYIAILLSFFIVSCSTTQTILISPIEDFPIRPDLIKYTQPPIINKDNENFLVTNEFIFNSVQLKEYDDRIQLWKKKHKIE